MLAHPAGSSARKAQRWRRRRVPRARMRPGRRHHTDRGVRQGAREEEARLGTTHRPRRCRCACRRRSGGSGPARPQLRGGAATGASPREAAACTIRRLSRRARAGGAGSGASVDSHTLSDLGPRAACEASPAHLLYTPPSRLLQPAPCRLLPIAAPSPRPHRPLRNHSLDALGILAACAQVAERLLSSALLASSPPRPAASARMPPAARSPRDTRGGGADRGAAAGWVGSAAVGRERALSGFWKRSSNWRRSGSKMKSSGTGSSTWNTTASHIMRVSSR